MKAKFFTLFAAFVLLFSAQASAQANGDVNGDGKVEFSAVVGEEEPKPEPYVSEFEANGIHYIFLEKYVSNDGLAAWVTSTNGWFAGEENTYSGDIVIPATVTYGGKEYSVMGICENAFKKCSINSLTLSEGIVYISPNAFEETHIGALYLPSTFRMWDNFFTNEVNGYMLLQGCLGLETLVVSPDHPLYDSRDNCNAIIETATNTLIEGCKGTVIPSSVTTIGPTAFIGRDIVEFVIPEGVKEVKGRVFERCKNLQSVVFPTSVEVIKGNMLFHGCSSLTSVEIPQTTLIRSAEDYEDPFETPGAMVIPSYMFSECSSLKEFAIPENVTSIGSAAFFICENLEAITIPESVIAIGDLAFFDCNKMTEITLLGQTPSAVPVDAFNETQYEQITLNVPEGAEEAYKQHEVWGKFFKEGVEEPEGLIAGKNYRVKNVTTGLYMQVSGNNTNMKLQNRADGVELSQVFQLEDAGEGMYYIKAADLSNSYYAHASGWNFNATANAANKTPFTIALVEGETQVYTLHQSVSNYKGLAGTDATEAGAAIYCNKGVDNNGKWAFEALTEEENAAYTATLTATARQAVEEAIARGEAVVANRSAVLTAEETAAINNAVQAAKEGKDAAADVTALKALSDAIHTAVDEAVYVWNTDALSNAMCYAVSTEDRGAWYAQASNLTSTAKAEAAVDVADSKQQFAFVKSEKSGALYLYSVSEANFVSAADSYTALTETPEQTISILNGTRSAQFPWVVALNAEDGQKQMGISNGYAPAVITHYNDLGDAGNTVRIEKVAAFDASAALAAIEALENPVITVTGITLSQTAATLTEGESLTLTATVAPEDATDKTITWSTSDAAIATVDNGVVTAVAAGTATITAKAGDKETTCVVTVAQKVIAVTGITLSQTAATLTEGESLTLTATVAPDNATDKTVAWSTSDAAVAIVENGVVTAVAAGTATITAKAGDEEATCVVTVAQKEEPFKGITSIDELNNETLYHVTLPHHSKGLASWAVAEGGTAMKSNVDLGLTSDATDAKQQFAFISNDGGATRYLYHAAEKKFVGKKGVLTEEPVDAILFKDGAHDNTFFAYFDENNYINVGGSQQMTIDRWSTADGGNSCVIAPVAVFNPAEALAAFVVKVSGITLSQTAATLTEGESLTLTATVAPEDATDKTVTWSTSDAAVATVDNNGKVSAVAAGTATITAKAGDKEATCVVTVKASVPDGIDQLTMDNGQWTIYDLTGRKVTSTENLKGGIYIVNGRKVVIGD